METIFNQAEEEPQFLAFHIRRFRQWYGEKSLEQDELAKLTGVSKRQLRRYESCRELPPGLSTLLSIAIALEQPLESIIAPDIIDEIRADVEARRMEFRGESEKSWYQPDEY